MVFLSTDATIIMSTVAFCREVKYQDVKMWFHRIAEGQLQIGDNLRHVYAETVYNWFSAFANNNNNNSAVLAKRRQVHAMQVNSIQTGCFAKRQISLPCP